MFVELWRHGNQRQPVEEVEGAVSSPTLTRQSAPRWQHAPVTNTRPRGHTEAGLDTGYNRKCSCTAVYRKLFLNNLRACGQLSKQDHADQIHLRRLNGADAPAGCERGGADGGERFGYAVNSHVKRWYGSLSILRDVYETLVVGATDDVQLVVDGYETLVTGATDDVQLVVDVYETFVIGVTDDLQLVVDVYETLVIGATDDVQLVQDVYETLVIGVTDDVQLVQDVYETLVIGTTDDLQLIVNVYEILVIGATDDLQLVVDVYETLVVGATDDLQLFV
ncbi:hypothetical protein MAR_025392 [Mya arenaria]|uniref:Uncharacterized protein n=1 Tax=Mya arenaria TaxID=6604 RepID=A0ABY7DU93_MYAAR|nr:hypothetical protein MAR_025392 [Mya arenaria]